METHPTGATLAVPPLDPAPRKLKILMLHGYTQSGPLFHAKTRALEKHLQKAFPAAPSPTPLTTPSTSSTSTPSHPSKPSKPKAPKAAPKSLHHPLFPGGVSLTYPTAPLRLSPADIPGFAPSDLQGAAVDGDVKAESDAWGWWKRETGSGVYTGLEDGLETIRQTILAVGGIDGVIGFSQGGCMAAFVASLLEPSRAASFAAGPGEGKITFPEGWKELQEFQGGRLRFAISYSGFYSPQEAYRPFYEPKISTPLLNVIGSLDSVVEESRSMGLVERCEESTRKVVFHPGGHFVPVGKDMVGVLVGFIGECLKEQGKEEVSVEDMDVPF